MPRDTRSTESTDTPEAPTPPTSVRVTKKTSISTTSGILTFKAWTVYSDPAYVHLILTHKVPHEPC